MPNPGDDQPDFRSCDLCGRRHVFLTGEVIFVAVLLVAVVFVTQLLSTELLLSKLQRQDESTEVQLHSGPSVIICPSTTVVCYVPAPRR